MQNVNGKVIWNLGEEELQELSSIDITFDKLVPWERDRRRWNIAYRLAFSST